MDTPAWLDYLLQPLQPGNLLLGFAVCLDYTQKAMCIVTLEVLISIAITLVHLTYSTNLVLAGGIVYISFGFCLFNHCCYQGVYEVQLLRPLTFDAPFIENLLIASSAYSYGHANFLTTSYLL